MPRNTTPNNGRRGLAAKSLFAESQPGLLAEFRRLKDSDRRRRFQVPADVATELGCNPRTIRHWCDNGRLDFVRVGGRLYVDGWSLERKLEEAGEE
ncbi:MAG: helix-turn-helix domain-containing protein [Acidobacteria bacterium]|nr:helix-turn-helix domain-containing protein [Acidobacteriota bacterium]